MEDSEVCTVPGGLAKMKKQFEKEEMTSTRNAFSEYQYHHQSRSEQVLPLCEMGKSFRGEFALTSVETLLLWW